jgi:thioredoxin 2
MADANLIRCQSCGATNRLPEDPLGRGQKAVCGRCKTPLARPACPTIVSDATFAADVERSTLPVLVDLWAPWCGPCRTLGPIVDELATELAGRVRVAKMNVDDNPATSARFAVRSIPTLLVFKDGREVDRLVGAHPKGTIAARLERVLTPAARSGDRH